MPRHVAHTAAIALVAFVLRAAWGLAVELPPAWDAVLYERGARAIESGLGYTCFMFGPRATADVPTAFYPVGYPAFLAVAYWLFGASHWVVTVLGSSAGALTAALTHRLTLRVASPRMALIAASVYAVLPGLVIFASTPMTETLWGALLLLSVWCASPQRDGTFTTKRLFFCALSLTAAVYVRPQALVLAPIVPAVVPGTLRARARRAMFVTALTLALIAPWTARNCASLDACALVSTNGGSNLAIGALPRADGRFTFLTAPDGCRGVTGEVARDRCWRSVALGHIRRHPVRWLSLSLAKVHHTWAYEAFPVGYLREARPELLSADDAASAREAITAAWRVLTALALIAVGLVLPFRQRRPITSVEKLCVIVPMVVTVTHAVFFGGDRYHLPLVAFVVVIAATVSGTNPDGSRPRASKPSQLRPLSAGELSPNGGEVWFARQKLAPPRDST